MMKKIVKYSGIAFALLSLLSLSLPVFSTQITDGEACDLMVKGYNLVEFSPWGGIVLLTPLVLLGLMLSKLKNATKTVGLIILFVLNGVALCASTSAAYKWMCDVSTGFVEPHMYHVIYALLLFVAMVCFFMWCNCSLNIKSLKDFFVEEERIEVEPVDYRTEKFYLCNKVYDSAKYKENGDVVNDKSTVCFATNDGYFVALDDSDTGEYFTVELLENDGSIGFMMGNMPTGVYGVFYEDYNFRRDLEVGILPFDHIEKDGALVWILDDNDEDGAVGHVVDVEVTANSLQDIRIKILGESNENIIGCAVVQGLSLVGFVTEYDVENNEYKCISAELLAVDLCRKIYEHRVWEKMRERELKKTK